MSAPPAKGNTIYARNKEDTIEVETLFWRAMCDKPNALKKYLSDDAVLALPGGRVFGPDTEPSLKEHLDKFRPWTAYRMDDDPQFIEIDMMSSTLIYRVTAWRQKGDKMVPTEGVCSSVWRQGAGGDWKLCAHHMTSL